MPKPRVFVSSVYVGLKDLRAAVANFLTAEGYEPVLFERGGVGFDNSEPLDESCSEAVKSCDIFVLVLGGRYGSSASRGKNRGKRYISVTHSEYLAAMEARLPVYVFVESDVHAEYATWRKNPAKNRKQLVFAHVDNPQVFELIHKIYLIRKNNLIQTYVTADDVVRNLREQLAGLVHRYAVDQRARATEQSLVRINSFKLFYHRHSQKLSFTELARKSGIDKATLRHLESVDSGDRLTTASFPEIEKNTVGRLQDVLKVPGPLQAGRPDDFLSAYMLYYAVYKRHSFIPRSARPPIVFQSRAVVFDFDGTLTRRPDDETSWEKIWKRLGYGVQECANLHSMFTNRKLTHERWCEITTEKFRARDLRKTHVDEISRSITLVAGTAKTLREIRSRGVRLYLLSGSIRQVIENVLGDLAGLFDDIRANEFVYDDRGFLERIIGTRYDFEGKSEYLAKLIEKERWDPLEVLFVGNSCNDVFASRSGARTLCVNPRFTDPANVEHWTYFVRKMANLSEVLPYVFPESSGSGDGERAMSATPPN